MIRFVDLRSADIAGYRFAFWDTVRDRFVEFSSEQSWDDLDELMLAYGNPSTDSHRRTIDRLTELMPEWAKEGGE